MSAACPTFAFVVDVQLDAHVNPVAQVALWNSFCHALDARGLICTGAKRAGWPTVVRGEASQATDADRQAISEWAASHVAIVGVDVGQLLDLSAPD
ncbi:MAG TPA: 50S ribosome-binding protein YggL [Gemmatimonadaceae bacterium]|jgi:hypothetical protein